MDDNPGIGELSWAPNPGDFAAPKGPEGLKQALHIPRLSRVEKICVTGESSMAIEDDGFSAHDEIANVMRLEGFEEGLTVYLD